MGARECTPPKKLQAEIPQQQQAAHAPSARTATARRRPPARRCSWGLTNCCALRCGSNGGRCWAMWLGGWGTRAGCGWGAQDPLTSAEPPASAWPPPRRSSLPQPALGASAAAVGGARQQKFRSRAGEEVRSWTALRWQGWTIRRLLPGPDGPSRAALLSPFPCKGWTLLLDLQPSTLCSARSTKFRSRQQGALQGRALGLAERTGLLPSPASHAALELI